MNVTLGGHVECIEELLGKLSKMSDFISNTEDFETFYVDTF